jgi:hypothetical protein
MLNITKHTVNLRCVIRVQPTSRIFFVLRCNCYLFIYLLACVLEISKNVINKPNRSDKSGILINIETIIYILKEWTCKN